MRQELIATKFPMASVEHLFFYSTLDDDDSASVRNESPSAPNSRATRAPADHRAPPIRGNWILLVSAIVLVGFAFTLAVCWLDPANDAEQATQRGEPRPAGHPVPQSLAQFEKVAAKSEPVAPVDESRSAAPSRAPNAATHPQSPTSPQPAAPAAAKPKKESVLGSVLAPPPA
jgi:hypothetical protein